jgi:hypothetical protein
VKRNLLADLVRVQWAGIKPQPVFEFQFHPTRKWMFDVAFPELKIFIEQHGGAWTQGRHTRGAGFIGDLEKVNQATLLGWRGLFYTPEQMQQGIWMREVHALISQARSAR